MNNGQKKPFNLRKLLPILPIAIILIILGAVFIPDVLGTMFMIILFSLLVCLPCGLAFFVHKDFFELDDAKGILGKTAIGLGIILFSAVLTAVLIMTSLQGVTIIYTKALCPVGFTYITTKPLSIPYYEKNNTIRYRKTVEVTANNKDFSYNLDEFPVFACIILIHFFIGLCITGAGFLINTLCMKKGKPVRRFLFIPLAYIFILLIIFIPQPASDLFQYGIRGILFRGWTPLLYNAAEDNNTSFLDELIKHGANINTKDNYGKTPLFTAVEKGNFKIVQTLLTKGARQNIKNREGNTPLMIAVIENEPEILRFLLEKGARVEIKNKQGKTALDLARYEEKTDILEIFKQAGY